MKVFILYLYLRCRGICGYIDREKGVGFLDLSFGVNM